jgi:retron-type reverse transcriptase
LRYVDDIALFADDWGFLTEARPAIEEYLAGIRLKIHPIKSQLFETRQGATFVGFRVLPNQIRVRSENLRRARRRLRHLQTEFARGVITWQQVDQSVQSWLAHLQHGTTWYLRQKILENLVFSRE